MADQPLWESQLFIIRTGFHTQEVPVPSIPVPERFTWTIQFYGLSMRTGISTGNPAITNDFAGLLFYGLASIGLTYNDFWQRLPNVGWTPVEVLGVPKNNFACQVTSLPEAIPPKLTIRKDGNRTVVVWLQTFTRYTLQSKLGLDGEWSNVPNLVVVKDGNYEVTLFGESAGLRIFSTGCYAANDSNTRRHRRKRSHADPMARRNQRPGVTKSGFQRCLDRPEPRRLYPQGPRIQCC